MIQQFLTSVKAVVLAALIFTLVSVAGSQTPAKRMPPPQAAVKVTQIDEIAFKKLMDPAGKPLLINFWATWCDPCREEFPELVEIDKEFKGKIDFITISLDDPADINTTVPKFLTSMKAEMPAYLLKTADESGVISSISKSWAGGMPFTALYNTKGELAYFREGKVVMATLREELNKLIAPPAAMNQAQP
jgi:thiol-disulfide isomerase/thioredoxin